MSDIKESLLAGISAARVAIDNKAEIQSILNDIDNLLVEMYDGKVRFKVKNFQATVRRPGGVGPLATRTVEYQALALTDRNGGRVHQLAHWSISENGYPCKISYDGNDIYCANRDELNLQISNIFKDVKTGKAILEWIDIPPLG